MLLEVYLFVLGYPICWHMIILLFPKSIHRDWKRELQCPESLGAGAYPVLFSWPIREELFLGGQFLFGGQLCCTLMEGMMQPLKLSLLPRYGVFFSGLLFHCVAKISEVKSRALLVHVLSCWGIAGEAGSLWIESPTSSFGPIIPAFNSSANYWCSNICYHIW